MRKRDWGDLSSGSPAVNFDIDKMGTVGAVARDRAGHLAAATSTGGTSNKRFGRIGDSPILGAGTWAKDATCAISATGHGEIYIREAAASQVSVAMGRKVIIEHPCIFSMQITKPLSIFCMEDHY
jgi:beta-aspartyl-peptidase (threonine type)